MKTPRSETAARDCELGDRPPQGPFATSGYVSACRAYGRRGNWVLGNVIGCARVQCEIVVEFRLDAIRKETPIGYDT
jgi:hypothetical protein